MSKHDPITQLLATAGEVYEREISPVLVSAFRSALAGIPESALADAFQAHLSDPKAGSFFPKPADILRHVRFAATLEASSDFDRLMQWACGGPLPAVNPESRRLFDQATSASTFDMRRWSYERWDAVRSRYLALVVAQGGGTAVEALGHDSHPALEYAR